MRIHFVLAANNEGSITRLAAEYANGLAARGHEATVSYPVLGYWDENAWRAREEFPPGMRRRLRFLRRLAGPAVKAAVRSRGLGWRGAAIHRLDPRVRLNRFWALPTAGNMPAADVIVVLQNYLIPRLMLLPREKGVVVGSVHLDYEEALRDPDGTARASNGRLVEIERRVRAPRFAVSERARRAAERLGIPVDGVVNNGINLREFAPPSGGAKAGPLTATLFCSPVAQKGQDFGCEVVRALKAKFPGGRVRFASLGVVKKENAGLFDRNLGYLHGAAYVRAHQEADVFIYPSLFDGFPAPPLEAMACGRAVVTTRVQGVDEYGVDGENCLMSEPRDVGAMTTNAARALEDEGLRRRLGDAGKATAARYSWESCTDKLASFLESAVGR